jgi:hypothetical protein
MSRSRDELLLWEVEKWYGQSTCNRLHNAGLTEQLILHRWFQPMRKFFFWYIV